MGKGASAGGQGRGFPDVFCCGLGPGQAPARHARPCYANDANTLFLVSGFGFVFVLTRPVPVVVVFSLS